MIVEYSAESGARLVEPFDFHSFKLVLKGEPVVGAPASTGITLVDRDNTLVSVELVPALPGRPDGEGWEASYAKMVASARERGWIEAEANAIRAHIERQF